jgi:hypothetical protein
MFPVVVLVSMREPLWTCSSGSLRNSSSVASTGCSQGVCEHYVNSLKNEEFLNILTVFGYCNDNSITADDVDIGDDFHSDESKIGMYLAPQDSNV